MSTPLTEDELRHLTAEERKMLEEDDYDPEADNAAALAASTNQAASEEAGAAAGAAAAPATGAAADDGQAAAAGGAAGAGAAASAADQPGAAEAEAATPAPAPQHSAPTYQVDLPADFQAQQDANKSARTELRRRYNEGEIDSAEFESEQDRLDEQRMNLLGMQQRAQIAQEMTEQAQRNAWVGAINNFMKQASTNSELGIVDYRKDAAKQADLDTFVKALAAQDPDKPQDWYLSEAHKRVVALHGVPTTAKTAAKPDTSRKPNLDEIPQTLAHTPGTSGNEAFEDEFSALDKMSGMEAERALAAMPKHKQDLYLARG
jgi:hypothetical protein